MELITIREAITRSEQLPPDGILYSPEGEALTLETTCALIVDSDWEDDDDPPESLSDTGKKMVELLPVDPFQQVVWNAYDQRPDASKEMVVKGLQYYVERDAFIDFDLDSAEVKINL